MSFEKPQFMGSRLDKMREEKEGGRKSAKEILADPEMEDIKLAVMERSNQEEIGKKLLEKGVPTENEFDDLNRIAGEVEAVNQDVEWMREALEDGSLFNELATTDADFAKWQSLIGSEGLGEFYNRDYFIKLRLDDNQGFKNLKKKIEKYQGVEEKIRQADAGLEQRVSETARELKIPLNELGTIFNLEDSGQRTTALDSLIKRSLPYFYQGKRREEAQRRLQAILVDGDNFVRNLKEKKGGLGQSEKRSLNTIAQSFLGDDKWKKETEKKVGEIFTDKGPEAEEKMMSFSEVSRFVSKEGRHKLQEDWKRFQEKNVPDSIRGKKTETTDYWNQLSDAKFSSKKEQFFQKIRGQKSGGYWWDLMKMISSVDLTKEFQVS